MLPYETWISVRYLTAKKGRFLSFMNFISIAGVAIGVMALIVVIGIMTGFGNNLREKIIGTTPHIMIEREFGIAGSDAIIAKIKTIDGVVGASAYIQNNIFLEEENQAMSMVVRGIDPQTEGNVTKVKEFLKKGNLEDLKDDGVIIGKELARYFGYSVGDKITLISPSSGMSGQSWRYKMTVVGIFNTGMADFDMHLVLVDLKKAREIFNLDKDVVSGIGVKLKDVYKAKEVKEKIFALLGFEYVVKTWIDINRNLFEALFLEKWGLFLILTLMILVASFNIISTLIVTVTSKTHDIGILKSIGVPKRAIHAIFMRQGLYIGGLGIFWGVVSGLGISYLLHNYFRVPQDIYSIDHVPVDIQPTDILAIVVCAFVISFLATIYPARKASELQPVEALRYE